MKELLAKLKAAQLRAQDLGKASEMTEEESATFDAALKEVETIRASIVAYEARQTQMNELNTSVDSVEKRLAQPTSKPADNDTRSDITATKQDNPNPYANPADFYRAVMTAARSGQVDTKLMEIRAASGLSEAVPSDGGFLVQQDIASGIYQSSRAIGGQILSAIDTLAIKGNGMKIPAVAETTYASGVVAGGIVGYWMDEAGAKTASKPQFRNMDLSLKKVAALVYATDELLEDANALAAFIGQNAPLALNWQMEDAIINGNGAGKPLGILNGGSLVTVSEDTTQTTTTISTNNIVNMLSRLMPSSLLNSAWYINPDILPQLMQLSLNNNPLWLMNNTLEGAPLGTLLGRPIIPIEHCATLGTVGDIILADLSQYQGIEKAGIQEAMSIHVKFVNDESVFRFVKRFDGQPKLNSAITPAHGTNTISPFVVIETRDGQ